MPENLRLEMWEFREFKDCVFLSIDFFNQMKDKQMVGLTNEKPQSIISFNFTKFKTTGVNTLIKKERYDYISVNPDDKYLVLLSSQEHRIIKLHRINDKMKGDEFQVKSSVSHDGLTKPRWLSANNFVIGSNEGFAIFLFNLNKKLKIEMTQRIESFEGSFRNDLYKILYLEPFSQGFICGLNDGTGLLVVDDKEGLIKYKMNNLELMKDRFIIVSRSRFGGSDSRAQCLDFSHQEKKCLIVSHDNSVSVILTKKIIAQKNFNIGLISDFSLRTKEVESYGHPMTFKQGKIDTVDVAEFKTLMMMVSIKDNSFKLVDFEKRTLEIQHFFGRANIQHKQVTAGALHPSGLYAVLGFEDRLDFYSISYSGLK